MALNKRSSSVLSVEMLQEQQAWRLIRKLMSMHCWSLVQYSSALSPQALVVTGCSNWSSPWGDSATYGLGEEYIFLAHPEVYISVIQTDQSSTSSERLQDTLSIIIFILLHQVVAFPFLKCALIRDLCCELQGT